PNGENDTYTRPDGTLVVGTRDLAGLNPPDSLPFARNGYIANIGNSAYHSFQASLERRAADFTFLMAYTFGKALDNSSGFNSKINFSNHRLSRSLSTFDITHNFVVSYTYDVPLDKAFHSIPKRLTQGWSLNG